jgi:O-antigen ligase
MLLGGLPFLAGTFPKFQIALAGSADWPAYVQGIEISALDLLATAIYFALPKQESRAPFKFAFLLYILAILISAAVSPNPSAAVWYAFQFIRVFFVYLVVFRICSNLSMIYVLLQGMALGVCFEAADVLWQRFVIHSVQSGGNFGHQNNLGFALHFYFLPFAALLLSGNKGWQYIAVPFLIAVMDIFTVSRAAVGLAAVGFVALLGASGLRRWTPRKTKVAVGVLVAVILLTPVAIRSFDLRGAVYGFGSVETSGREALNRAAQIIASEHPMGIGAANFVIFGNANGIYDRAGIYYLSTKNTSPHDVYWTALAETGYLGLFSLLLLLIRPMIAALQYSRFYRQDERGDLLLGIGIALITIIIHCAYEWVLFKVVLQYIWAMDVGIVGALVASVRSSRRQRMAAGTVGSRKIPSLQQS